MKKTLFVLAAVVVAYFSSHATAEPVSPAAAAGQPPLAAGVPADASSGAQAPSLPLTIISDNASHPAKVAASSSPDNANRLAALTGFLQSTGEDLPQQSTAETTALSISAHWGIVLIGCSALYMLTIRRNRSPHL